MSPLVVIPSALLLALLLAQVPYVVACLRALGRRPAAPLPAERCGPAVVVLPVRGADPTLAACLRGLLAQDHPRYEVRVVLDAATDPAGPVVEEVLRAHPSHPVRVEILERALPTCTRKCSALVQALSDLPARFDVVAHVDGDTVPHRTWLRELAGGLEDPSVGVVTGHRWYTPTDSSWGSLLRSLWNAAAVPQLVVYGVAWGGTMAVRAELVRSGPLLDRWRHAYGDDTALTSALRPLGLRVRFEPSLLMLEPGGTTLSGFLDWVRRQLFSVRMEHPAWPWVLVHGVLVAAAPLAVLAASGVSLAMGDGAGATLGLAAWLGYQASGAFLLTLLDRSARRAARDAGRSVPARAPAAPLRRLLGFLLLQPLYTAALLRAATVREVDWRGVTYRTHPSGGIRAPYQ